jgi:hypothetical protein
MDEDDRYAFCLVRLRRARDVFDLAQPSAWQFEAFQTTHLD